LSDRSPTLESPKVEETLRRRVVWGLAAGRSKAEIAQAEGLSLEACEAVVCAQGVALLFSAWMNFLERRRLGGRREARAIAHWALEGVIGMAEARIHPRSWDRVTQLARILVIFGLSLVLGWLLRHLDGVMAASGPPRRALGPWRQGLVDAMAWAIEIALMQELVNQIPEEHLLARERFFRRFMAAHEITERGQGDAGVPATPHGRPVHPSPTPAPILTLKPPLMRPPPEDQRFKRRQRPLPPLVPPRRIERAA
jgi:hypothetical protein